VCFLAFTLPAKPQCSTLLKRYAINNHAHEVANQLAISCLHLLMCRMPSITLAFG
jgi:hypothetical protein